MENKVQERHVFKRWSELTEEERTRNNILSRAAVEWMKKNPGVMLTYRKMNECGLKHFYRWHVDEFNYTHQWSRMVIEKDGIVIRKEE